MRRNRPLPTTALGLPPSLTRALVGHGFVTAAQVQELAQRIDDDPCRALFGTGAEVFGRMVSEACLQEAVTAPIPRSFSLPPLTGLAGPGEHSAVIRRGREDTADERRALTGPLERIRDELPTRMLLQPWMSPVRSQGALGTCTGWASAANYDVLARTTISARFPYDLAKHLDGRPDLEGSWLYFCFEGFTRHGTLRERDYPYHDRPDRGDVQRWFERAAELRSDGYVDLHLEQERLQPVLMKAVLSGRLTGSLGPQPVSVSVPVFESWASGATSLYGLVSLPLPGEALLGGHAMCVAGYIDGADPDGLFDTDYFILKNSWGSAWAPENPLGLPGYALVPAEYFARRERLWESLVLLAGSSPVTGAGWLDRLRARWSE